MSKKGGSAPKAPDPHETASAEASLNRLDTFSPSGSGTRYGYTDSNGNFVQGVAPEGRQSAVSYNESDAEAAIRSMLEPASVDLTQQIIADNVTDMPAAPTVRDRSDVAGDIFNRNFSLMAPGIEKANEALLTNLQARGIPIGAEAFNDAYGEQVAQTQDTVSRLAQDANITAGQEQSRQFSLDQAERSDAISEIVAALGGGYNPPNSVPSGAASGVNVSQLVNSNYQNELAEYQSAQDSKMATASAIGQTGAMLLKSTVHAKEVHGPVNPHAAAQVLLKMPMWVWSYKPEHSPAGDHASHHLGPMAEDFKAMTGFGASDKIDAIDYLGILASALQSALMRLGAIEAMLSNGQLEAAVEPRSIH